MLITFAILALLLALLAMLVLRLARPDFIYHWLFAMGGALLAWILMLVAGLNLPQSLPILAWQPASLFPEGLVLLVDRLSWPYALALATLILAVILTDVFRAPEADWNAWSASLGLTALGIVAVLAGNPLTLLLAWSAIDLVELAILLGRVNGSSGRERVVLSLSARVSGSGLLVAAILVASAAGETLTFDGIAPATGLLLLLAAGLRLGVLPLHLSISQEPPLRRGLGTTLRLVPAAAGLVLLARMAAAIPGAVEAIPWSFYLLAVSGLAAVYAGVTWFFAPDELAGRPAWLLGMASFSVASALRGQPSASLAWGIAALFSGGLIFLSSNRDRRLIWLTLLGALGISTLPFTPAWNGARLYASPFHPLLVLFLLALASLLLGYLRHTLRPGKALDGVDRWVWLIYPAGLALLSITHFVFGLWTNPTLQDVTPAGWWVSAIVLGLSTLGFIWAERGAGLSPYPWALFESIFSLKWLYSSFWSFYRSFGRFITFLTTIFEGEGGVLWAMLVLVLLLSLLARNGGA